MPSTFIDHHAVFPRPVGRHRPEPADESARAAHADPDYHEGLVAFGRELARLTDPIWRTRYVGAGEEPGPPGLVREGAPPGIGPR